MEHSADFPKLCYANGKRYIMPFWREFFAPLWAYSCFKHIKTAAVENDIPETLSSHIHD